MRKNDVIKIIDEVMNNREIDSIRNAILAIRDKVIDFNDNDWTKEYRAKLRLRRSNELCCTTPYFEGATHVVIDTSEKIDTGLYGCYWYERDDDTDEPIFELPED